jgi:hypothetical protein
MKATTLMITLGITCLVSMQPASAQPDAQQATVSPPQCDSVSFAQGTAENRAACRRIYAHQMRRNSERLPNWAVDYEW